MRLIIDTDPGVDDSLAIFMAFNDPTVQLLGLTTVFGNVPTAMATANALHLLELGGRGDVRVAQGALGPLSGGHTERFADFVHGADGLGNTGTAAPASTACALSAAQLICEAANEFPGEVVVLALAPLTNVALALRLDPSVAIKLKSLVVLGGAFACSGNVNPAAEANVFHDPEAADLVFGSFPDDVVSIVGLDVTQRCVLSGAQLESLRDSSGRFAAYSYAISQFYKAYHQQSVGLDGIYLHDPSTLEAVLRPQLFEWASGPVRVGTQGVLRGRTVADLSGRAWRGSNEWTGRPRCRIATGVDAPAVVARVIAGLSQK